MGELQSGNEDYQATNAAINKAIQKMIQTALTGATGGETLTAPGGGALNQGRIEVQGATDFNLNVLVTSEDLGGLPDQVRQKLENDIQLLVTAVKELAVKIGAGGDGIGIAPPIVVTQ
jgi:hypothetical protein